MVVDINKIMFNSPIFDIGGKSVLSQLNTQQENFIDFSKYFNQNNIGNQLQNQQPMSIAMIFSLLLKLLEMLSMMSDNKQEQASDRKTLKSPESSGNSKSSGAGESSPAENRTVNNTRQINEENEKTETKQEPAKNTETKVETKHEKEDKPAETTNVEEKPAEEPPAEEEPKRQENNPGLTNNVTNTEQTENKQTPPPENNQAQKEDKPVQAQEQKDTPEKINPVSQNNDKKQYDSGAVYYNATQELADTNGHGKKLEVVIDPGHGGAEPGGGTKTGASNPMVEKDFILDVSLKVKDYLTSKGVNVIMTRDKDKDLAHTSRAGFANKQYSEDARPDSFVSIHANNIGDSSANGTLTIYNNSHDAAKSKQLAEKIQSNVAKGIGTSDKGITRDVDLLPYSLPMVRDTQVPSALVEVGFASNDGDRAKMADHDRVAKAIANGILQDLGLDAIA